MRTWRDCAIRSRLAGQPLGGARLSEREEKIVSEYSLALETRSATGKGAARKLRGRGRIPGVVYGRGREPVSVSVDPLLLERLLKSSHAGINTLIDLQGESAVAGRTVLVKELQREPLRGSLLHADFFEVDLKQRLDVSVPVHVKGEPRGVQMGGVLEHTLREIELSCYPNAIPDEIIVDVSALEIGDMVHVNELALPADVELLTEGSLAVVSVIIPRATEEAAAPPAEVQVVGAAPTEAEAGTAEEGESD